MAHHHQLSLAFRAKSVTESIDRAAYALTRRGHDVEEEERRTKIVLSSINLPTIQGKSAQTATVSLSVLVLRLTDGHHRHHRRRQQRDKVPKWLYGDFRRSRVSKNLLGQ